MIPQQRKIVVNNRGGKMGIRSGLVVGAVDGAFDGTKLVIFQMTKKNTCPSRKGLQKTTGTRPIATGLVFFN